MHSLTPVDNGDIFLIRACGLCACSSTSPGLGLGGLAPRPDGAGLVGHLSSSFRAQWPRMRIDDLFTPSGISIARVPVSVTTADRRPRHRAILPTTNTAFVLVFAVPFEVGKGSAETHAAVTTVAQHAPPPTSTSQGEGSAVIIDPAESVPSLPGNPAPLWSYSRLPAASPPVRAGEPLPLALRRLLLIIASGTAGPLDHPPGVLSSHRESQPQDRPSSYRLVCPNGTPLVRPRPRRACGNSSFKTASDWRIVHHNDRLGCPR